MSWRGDGGAAKKVAVKVGVDRQVVLTPEDWKWTENLDGDGFLRMAIWCI